MKLAGLLATILSTGIAHASPSRSALLSNKFNFAKP